MLNIRHIGSRTSKPGLLLLALLLLVVPPSAAAGVASVGVSNGQLTVAAAKGSKDEIGLSSIITGGCPQPSPRTEEGPRCFVVTGDVSAVPPCVRGGQAFEVLCPETSVKSALVDLGDLNDRFVLEYFPPGVTVIAGDGSDSVNDGGESEIDRIFAGPGDDEVEGRDASGEGGDDVIEAINGEASGGPGSDRIHIPSSASGEGWAFGGPGNDLLVGARGRNKLNGGSGRDTLLGKNAADVLHGGAGHDICDGGANDNHIVGLPGQDGPDRASGCEQERRIP
jgi:hypothetical protein